jgi:hypothetical protein
MNLFESFDIGPITDTARSSRYCCVPATPGYSACPRCFPSDASQTNIASCQDPKHKHLLFAALILRAKGQVSFVVCHI